MTEDGNDPSCSPYQRTGGLSGVVAGERGKVGSLHLCSPEVSGIFLPLYCSLARKVSKSRDIGPYGTRCHHSTSEVKSRGRWHQAACPAPSLKSEPVGRCPPQSHSPEPARTPAAAASGHPRLSGSLGGCLPHAGAPSGGNVLGAALRQMGGLVQKHARFLVPGGEIPSSPEGPQWRRGRVTPRHWLVLPSLRLTCEPGVSVQIQIQSPLPQAALPEGSQVRVRRRLPTSRLVQSLQAVWASERKLSQQGGTEPHERISCKSFKRSPAEDHTRTETQTPGR